ncbi:chromate efflux transporter [Luteimonas pelagia]
MPFRLAVRVWWRIGWLGFGGPAGQIALMHRELVERRRWIGESRFLHALNFCMLLPGPEAQQLAVYIGWLMHGIRGGLVAGVLFVLPGALVLGVLAALYVAHGDLPQVAAVFRGLQAAVVALVVEALLRIGRRALVSPAHVAIAALGFLALFALDIAFPWVVMGGALVGAAIVRYLPASGTRDGVTPETDARYAVDAMMAGRGPAHLRPSGRRQAWLALALAVAWTAPLLVAWATLGPTHAITEGGVFFSQAALVTFGGAYAVLAYVAQRAVEDLAWLSPREMLDGLALAETTPGPLIMVLQFVGFLAAFRFPGELDPWLAGVLGAALATWVTFVPSFAFIFLGAPHVERLRGQPLLRGALQGITAAIVGVVLSLSAWFASRAMFTQVHAWDFGIVHVDVPAWETVDWTSVGIAGAAFLALWKLRVDLGWVLAGAALAGLGAWIAGG